jgi:hypothetical protein
MKVIDKNEIKKALYKEGGMATFIPTKSIGSRSWRAQTSLGWVMFTVPDEESVGFEDKIKASLLIRWLKL